MEKKRVDVKETRNLAKNKGREKKDGRKNGTRTVSVTTACLRKGSAGATAKIRVLDSVQTVGNIVSDVLHLLDDILIAASEYESGEVEGIEPEDDGSSCGCY